MTPVEGYALASWAQGYECLRDLTRPLDAAPRALASEAPRCAPRPALGRRRPVAPSPRQVLRGQLERLAERGWSASAATELEFLLFRTPYDEACGRVPRPRAGQPLHVDYSLMGTAKVEPIIRRIRNAMDAAGLASRTPRASATSASTRSTSATAGAADGRPARDLQERRQGDRRPGGHGDHVHGEVRRARGQLVPVHLSLRARTAARVFADEPATFDPFLAGLLATLQELTLLHAPNVNSYKRYAAGSFAPTAIAWGTTTAPAAPRRRTRPRAAYGVPHPRRRRQPLPRARRDDRGAACTASSTGSSSSPRSSAAPTSPTSRACPGRCATAPSFAAARSSSAALGEEVVAHVPPRRAGRGWTPSTPTVTD